jgi:Ferritin-like
MRAGRLTDPPRGPITTLAALHEHLQLAIELEHATIPAYLSALWSLRERSNEEVDDVLRSVVMEEMLHLTLAANVLNAVGGAPCIGDPAFLPHYPATLPHSDGQVVVRLGACTPAAIEGFKRIERPAAVGAPPEADRYHTIGQFYAALAAGLQRLAAEGPIFTGDPACQVGPGTYMYGALGDAIAVHDVDSALAALSCVVDQGEGMSGTIHDGDRAVPGGRQGLAHWYRFEEVAKGRRYRPEDTPLTGPTGPPLPVDWSAVEPVRPDPLAADLDPGSGARRLADQANETYTDLLLALHRAFNGEPATLVEAVTVMYRLERQGRALARVPVGHQRTAGATFEWRGR